jgi:hypothetical protein
MRLLHLAELTTRIHSDALLRAYAVAEEIFQEPTFDHSLDGLEK